MNKAATDDPIIIGGFYRTGSSLLRRLLDSHSRIHCGPEVKFFQDIHADYIDDPYHAIRFFTTIRSLDLSTDEIIDLFGSAFISSHLLAANKQGKPRWADKAPDNALYLNHWQRLLNNQFIVIHTIRHPLDVLASLNEAGFYKTVPQEFSSKLAMYDRYLTSAFRFAEKNPDKVIHLRYEELVSTPESTLATLFSNIGEVFEPEVLSNFMSEERQPGLEDPKVKSSGQVHSNSIGRWKTDLTEQQKEQAFSHLQPWLDKLKYQV